MTNRFTYKGNSLHNTKVYDEDICLFSLYTELEARLVTDKLNNMDYELELVKKENRELIIENNRLIGLLSEFSSLIQVCKDYNISISSVAETLEEYILNDNDGYQGYSKCDDCKHNFEVKR